MSGPAAPEVLSDPTLKRADLHCHSRFSVFKYFRRANTRDCYNEPEDVYRLAKERGMSFVTLTDHDSIDGALWFLNKHPDITDFFIGEEIAFIVAGYAIERAEAATHPTDVGVIEDAANDVGDGVAWDFLLAFVVGQACKL